ncbi:MAG TPA: acyl-CoA thioesterase II [Nocardioidaceae bacterium]|nr:acyl-CoA thioesterase II [Nocardioidaceae bacterium]
MPTSAEELAQLLDLETIDTNLFRGQQPDTTLQRVFGGQVAAQALVAAARTTLEELSVHSLHSYFLRPGDPNVAIVYDVDPVRDGKSFATRRVLARQHGRPIYAMTASFQVHEEGFEHQDQMPEVTAPEESLDLGEMYRSPDSPRADEWTRDWAALDLRWVGDSKHGLLGNERHPALARYWVRVSGRLPDDRLVHEAALTYASDLTLIRTSLVPHNVGLDGVQAASLDHSVWFHRPFRADEWLLYAQRSPSASGARGLIFGQLFTQEGVLVASVAQEGLIRPRPEA